MFAYLPTFYLCSTYANNFLDYFLITTFIYTLFYIKIANLIRLFRQFFSFSPDGFHHQIFFFILQNLSLYMVYFTTPDVYCVHSIKCCLTLSWNYNAVITLIHLTSFPYTIIGFVSSYIRKSNDKNKKNVF